MGVTVYLENLNKWYGKKVHAICDLSMEIREGELLVVVGPSGCGKSTLIRLIAGLESIDDGQVYMDKEIITAIPPKDRNIAMVPQSYALFPTMTVFDNIAFPLKMHKISRNEIKQSVMAVTDKLGLTNLLHRRPDELSGGQKQRVALARAMVQHPKLLLMDEPLSNLDAKLRGQMRREIVKLQKELGVTTIYVTHDQTEAMTMGNRIAILNEGCLQQIGDPIEVYRNPVNLFAASFIGSPPMNFIDCPLPEEIGNPLGLSKYSNNIYIGIRPENVVIERGDYTDNINMEISAVENIGHELLVYLENDFIRNMSVIVSADRNFNIGDNVSVSFRTENILIFDKKTGKRLRNN